MDKRKYIDFIEKVGQFGTKLNDVIEKIDAEKLVKFIKFINSYPEKFENLHKYLMTRGWYIYDDLPAIETLKLFEKDDKKVDEIMFNYVENKQQAIFDKSFRLFSKRKTILEQAYDAHVKGKYALSIPTLLTQIDGISVDLLENSFFKREDKNKMKLSKKYKEIAKMFDSNAYERILFLPLDIITSISYSDNFLDNERRKDDKFGPLNRHEILHGKSINYHNLGNSYRCILLIDLMCKIEGTINE